MSIAIAQLSDIHFRNGDDPALGRAQCIGSAIAAEVGLDARRLLLAICGDSTYSGRRSQFEIVRSFIETVESEIRKRRSDIEIVRVIIPGNHDCDFSGDQAAREALLPGLDGRAAPAESIKKIILSPLDEYFRFAAEFSTAPRTLSPEHPFHESFDMEDHGTTLRIHMLNTAWMSSLHEQVGALKFPMEAIVSPAGTPTCTVALLHHPVQWFSQPQAMRPLRDRLAEIAAIVLVNHEHQSEGRDEALLLQGDRQATRTLYVAGGALQEAENPEQCAFNILHIDTPSRSVCITQHTYVSGDEPFFKRTAKESKSLVEYQLTRGPNGSALREKFAQFLQDPGAPLRHPRRDPRIPIVLDEVYLYPDLWELDDNHKADGRKQVKSDAVAEKLLSASRVLVTGGDKSGRTSILKRLFFGAFGRGKTPVYLDGSKIPRDVKKLRNHVRKTVEEQYQNLTSDAFEQREPGARVALVDDLHRMRVSRAVRDDILEELERHFGAVILCSNDLLRIEELREHDAHGSHLWEYGHFVILGFGEHLREKFVRRWLELGADSEMSSENLDAETERICSLLNAVIKKQLLPTYPLFILLVLQQSELAHASVQSGSFGKLFEGVITAILSTSQYHRISISDKYFYLAGLAKTLFDRQSACLGGGEARHWHRSYWDRIELDIDYGELTRDLQELGVLSVDGEEVRFRYAYFYCFFLAYSLSRSVHDPEVREVIKQLAGQLHHRLSAEVVLFLAHLTSDPIVLDAMVETCDGLFADLAPAELGDDVAPLNRLGDVVEAIEISADADENKRAMKEKADAEIAERMAASDSEQIMVAPIADNEQIKQLFSIHAAYKTIQILGQALRNIAGSASRDQKTQVASRIVGLARRLLGLHLGFVGSEELSEVMQDMAAAHREQQPNLGRSDIGRQVCRDIWGLAQFICFMVVRHTTLSVGSENLSPTLDRVLGGELPIQKIMKLALDLECPGAFPGKQAVETYKGLYKNTFSASIARILVAHHFYLHVEPVQVRQSVCDQMDIKLLPSVLDRSRKRLL